MSYIPFVLQVFISVFFLLPIGMILVFLSVGIFCTIYLFLNGVNTIGLFLVGLGLVIFFVFLFRIFYGLVRNKKIGNWYYVFVCIPFFLIGGLLSFDMFIHFKYYNQIPPDDSLMQEKEYSYFLKSRMQFECFSPMKEENCQIDYQIDPSLKDNEVFVRVSYYADMVNVFNEHYIDIDGQERFSIYVNQKSIFESSGYLFMVLNHLKENRFYNYHLMYRVKVRLYTNEKTDHLILKK